MRKSRVALIKKTTIPRLELTAATYTVAVKANKMFMTELDMTMDRVVF